MKGSGLTQNRKKARRDGQRRQTSNLNSKQRIQEEGGERKAEES